MNPLPFIKLFWKPLAGALLLAVIWWQIHSYGARRYDAGKAYVRVQWDAETDRLKAIADAKQRENDLQDAADAARNKEKEDAYRKNLAIADSERSRLERQLRNALQAAASSGDRRPESADQPGTVGASSEGSPEPPAEDTGLAAALADALTEAKKNADQLDALIAEIRPQL